MIDVCAQASIIEKRHGMLTMYRDVGGGGWGGQGRTRGDGGRGERRRGCQEALIA